MQREEWNELNTGDVLQHRDSGETYVVSDCSDNDGEQIYAVSRVIVARNPQEWTRVRKTVDEVKV